MCLTCGCDKPEADHGDVRNITYEQLRMAAAAAGITPKAAAKNLRTTVKKHKDDAAYDTVPSEAKEVSADSVHDGQVEIHETVNRSSASRGTETSD